ncbi:peptidoglycan amidohydrolase family protein [uncultured Anaerococcus sp.]|uniref:peptidoglycan amidohydrolase family protein n=1 Tax=uncultured Anaerococcus sp. TaxID=293428 RepID=UPI002616314F|nr:peptidoglycan amidohydrolase family protein [uncultured Anaerococcus sp.]
MADINKSLKRFENHHHSKGNFPYSMINRYGNPGFDCSSSVFYALIAGGFLPKNQHIGNTEDLFALARKGYFKEIYNYSEVSPGDIFIRGGEGTSLGAAGHTGMFYKKNGIVHSNYTNNGISYNDENSYISYYLDKYRSNNERYFRPIKDFEEKKVTPKKAILNRVIDISEWQDPSKIDYDTLAKNIDGAILRCSYTYSKDKSLKVDKHFERHYKELSKRKVPLGAYHFSRAVNKHEAIKEANFVYDLIKDKTFNLPIFVDMESEEQMKTSMKDISTTIYYWCKELEKKKCYVGFYCNISFLNTKVQDFIKKEFTFRLANYTTNPVPNYNGKYDMWQHTNTGKVPGYNGNLDLNRVYRDYIKEISSMGLNGTKKDQTSTSEDIKKVEDTDTFKVTDEELIDFIAKKNNTTKEKVKEKGFFVNFKN